MYINELRTYKDANCNSITVTFNYGEIRDISNACYKAFCVTNSEYEKTYAKMKFLFDMIKHGNIQPETVDALYTTVKKEKK